VTNCVGPAGLLGYGVDRVTHRSTGLESPTGGLFVDRLEIGYVVDELVVRDFGLRLRLRAETACSQTVSMALIPGVQAELA